MINLHELRRMKRFNNKGSCFVCIEWITWRSWLRSRVNSSVERDITLIFIVCTRTPKRETISLQNSSNSIKKT